MSSVGGSGSSNRHDEVMRRNREEYQANESEMVKKHHKEIRRLNEQHYGEIERLKKIHEDQMRQLQEASRKEISQRDKRYAEDINSVRSIYQKQLRNQTQNSIKREEQIEAMSQGSKDDVLFRMQEKIDRLNRDYERSLAQKDEAFQKSLALNREAQKKGMEDQREKLEKAHQKETKFLREDRDRRLSEIKNEYATYRKISRDEQQRMELQGIQKQQKASDDLLRAVGKERSARVQSEETLRDGFEDGLGRMRQKFDNALEEQKRAYSLGKDYLESDVKGRIGSQVSRLENENRDLKEQNIKNSILLKQKKDREIANIKDSFIENMNDLQRQRDEAVRAGNNKNSGEIKKINKEHSHELMDTHRSYLQRIENQNFEHREDYETLENTLATRIDQSQRNADRRIKNIVETTELSKQKVNEQMNESLEAMKLHHEDEIRQLRFQFEKEKREAVERIKVHAQEREVNHADQMARLKTEHEKEITKMQDEVRAAKKQAEESLKRTVDELKRAHDLSLEQQEYRHKDKLKSLEVEHSNRLKTLNRRHDEKIDKMAIAVQKKT